MMRLAVASRTFRELVSLYYEKVFNIDSLLNQWLGNSTAEFLGMMEEEVALICGINVLHFFMRAPPKPKLDVCVKITEFKKVPTLLLQEGYQYSGWPFLPLETPAGRLRARLTQEALLHQRRTGERAFREIDHIGTGLLFHHPHREKSINIRLLSGEPYRHILSQHSMDINGSAALMCYITLKSAVALFPRSTYIHYRSYLTGRRTTHDLHELFVGNRHHIRSASNRVDLDLVLGPPVSTKLWRDPELEAIPRGFGDRWCWTIPRKNTGTTRQDEDIPQLKVFLDKRSTPADALGSYKFEVRDWTKGGSSERISAVSPASYSMTTPPRQINFLLEVMKTVTGILYPTKPLESCPNDIALVDIDVFATLPGAEFDETLADVSKFFPGGAVSCRVHTNSTYTIREPKGLRIFIDNFGVVPPANDSIRRIFSLPWYGNVFIMKYTTTPNIDQSPPTSIGWDEIESVHRIVEEWLTTHVKQGIFDPRGLRASPVISASDVGGNTITDKEENRSRQSCISDAGNGIYTVPSLRLIPFGIPTGMEVKDELERIEGMDISVSPQWAQSALIALVGGVKISNMSFVEGTERTAGFRGCAHKSVAIRRLVTLKEKGRSVGPFEMENDENEGLISLFTADIAAVDFRIDENDGNDGRRRMKQWREEHSGGKREVGPSRLSQVQRQRASWRRLNFTECASTWKV
ncbi:hypothetical protein BKA70DRAFT_1240666 [Coprinopsis sp. MPI-PUGE-AT-0042]|nr:hypothetical protein BKA70DRAFT_1240666 [Coprinopsis sp. MPI-PUGE-AT-0042]